MLIDQVQVGVVFGKSHFFLFLQMRSYKKNKSSHPCLQVGYAISENITMNLMSKHEINEVWTSLKLNEAGLIPTVAIDVKSNEILMHAWMNKEAFENTLTTGEVTYYSRSRKKLWVKGEESGNKQFLIEMKLDCDKDTLLLKVDQKGNACHTGAHSCFDETLIWSKNE